MEEERVWSGRRDVVDETKTRLRAAATFDVQGSTFTCRAAPSTPLERRLWIWWRRGGAARLPFHPHQGAMDEAWNDEMMKQ